jgi:glucose-1-phosphate thymidylyltransferase
MPPDSHDKSSRGEVIGLIPMAGQGARIAPLPCSKELYPIGLQSVDGAEGLRPKVAGQYLLEKMKLAGVTRVFIVLRKGKWDIPEYFGDGSASGMYFAYLMMGLSFGPPFSLDKAYPFVEGKRIAFGFADILFQPDDAFVRLLARQETTQADVVLGLVLAHNPHLMDMIEVDENGRIHSMVLKPAQTSLRYAWICAVWTLRFTEFLHEFVSSDEAQQCRRQKGNPIDPQGDLPVGAVIQAAIRKGLRVEGVTFPTGTYIDIGTPEDLAKALRIYR